MLCCGCDECCCQLLGRCVKKGAFVPDCPCDTSPLALPVIDCTVVPIGVVTRIVLGSFPAPHSILYPGGRKVLKPWIRFGWPANSSETRLITPGVSILLLGEFRTVLKGSHGRRTYVWLLKSFIISKNLLYTSGWSANWTLTWSR